MIIDLNYRARRSNCWTVAHDFRGFLTATVHGLDRRAHRAGQGGDGLEFRQEPMRGRAWLGVAGRWWSRVWQGRTLRRNQN